METIMVRGIEESRPLVAVVRKALQGLLERNPVCFYEVVMTARDREHQMWGNTGQIAEDFGLLQGGEMHSSTRNAILASTEGNGLELRMCILKAEHE